MMIAFQITLFILIVLSVAMYYMSVKYKRKKQQEYGNDERWKSIVAAVTMAVYRYNFVLLALMAVGYGVTRMVDVEFLISLHNIFGLLCLALLSGSIVEFVAFHIYDRKM